MEKLNTFKWPSNEKHENIHNEKLTTMIKKFENHPSITKIKIKYASSGGEMPLNIAKQYRFTYNKMLTNCKNDAIVGEDIFPDSLKFGDITPAHKKDETTDKENYRLLSVLILILIN